MKKAASYLRRSTDRQQQSIDDQRAAIERFAEIEGYVIVAEFVDDAISGATTSARKAFLEMVEVAQKPDREWDTILVFDVSRFGRTDSDESGYYRHLLTSADVDIKYTADGLVGGEADEWLLPIKQVVAHKYVQDLSKLTIRGQVSRASKGRWAGGRPPFAFDLKYYDSSDEPLHVVRYLATGEREIRTPDGATVTRMIPMGEPLPSAGNSRVQLVPGDPDRVAVLQRIFGMYLDESLGLSAVAARLNAEGVPAPGRPRRTGATTAKWSMTTIRDIIKNPAYKGCVAWNRRSYAKFHKIENGHAVSRPKHRRSRTDVNPESSWIVVEDQHEALVPPERWERAQLEMRVRGGNLTGEQLRASRRNSPYVLSGLVSCSKCGGRFQGRKKTKGRKRPGQKRIETLYYCCGTVIRSGVAACKSTFVKKAELEDAIIGMAAEHLTEFVESGGAAALARLVQNEASTSTSDEAALAANVTADKAKLDELVECLSPALAPTLEPKIVELRERITLNEARLKDIERMRVSEQEARAWVEEAVRDAAALGDLMKSGTVSEQKAILRALTHEITLDPEKGTGEVAFYAVPMAAALSLGTKKGRDPKVTSSHLGVAGARVFAEERTEDGEIWRRHFAVHPAFIAA